LFLLIGKFVQKFKFHGFEKRLIFLFKFIYVDMLISKKFYSKYLFYAFEKLTRALNPIIWWGCFAQGLFHRKKRVRILYWKIQKLIGINKKHIWFFLRFLVSPKRNLSRNNLLF